MCVAYAFFVVGRNEVHAYAAFYSMDVGTLIQDTVLVFSIRRFQNYARCRLLCLPLLYTVCIYDPVRSAAMYVPYYFPLVYVLYRSFAFVSVLCRTWEVTHTIHRQNKDKSS